MKKFWKISPRWVAASLLGCLVVTNMLVGLAHLTGWWPVKVLLFLGIVFLPGAALLRVMRITLGTASAGVLYSFGLGVLVLMLCGLATNQIFAMFGAQRPLELVGILGVWNIVTTVLIIACILVTTQSVRVKKWQFKKVPKSAWLLGGLSLLLPCIATLGAFRLNNGGDALFAGLAICYTAGLAVYAFVLRHRLPDGLLAWLIFIIGLSVLLMTSMRGWDIVGHDIEREFRVYTLAHMHGRWDMALDRDPYNACLSITILPEVFAKLLDVSGLVVFKVILQVIFAVCPAVLFILLRQYASRMGALVGSMLFICYPTFINDSAMLTRQGVAYLFFALALLILSNTAQAARYKLLFLLCALGAILSHYSTAYMFVALFAVATVCKLCVAWWLKRKGKPLKYTTSHTVLSPLFAVLLFLMTFIWYSQITATSSGLAITLQKSFANIPKLFSSDNKSSDTSTALLFAGGKSQADLYDSYLMNSQQAGRPADVARAVQESYMPVLTSDDLPLTTLGEKLQGIGINPSVIPTLRQDFAKILQLLALLGVLLATYKLLQQKRGALQPDFVCLSLAGIMLLALLVVLPFLSVNYGVLRAFQQALIFMILPITLLLGVFGRRIVLRFRAAIATTGIILLFFLFTGFFAQILGGSSPSFSLNNRGLYYGLYYASQADSRAFQWLKRQVPKKSDARAANFNKAFMHDPEYPFARMGILPSQVGANTYTYLDGAQVKAQKLYTYHESSPLIMTFPIEYYDQAKNQLYSTATTRIYK